MRDTTYHRSQHADGPAGEVPLDFDEHYYAHYSPMRQPYARDDYWLDFFRKLAAKIVSDLRPTSVLDAGCALGILVETLRDLDVDAWGVDVSEWAIANVHESVREYCWQGSLSEPLPQRYDLITCIEVLEHLPTPEAEVALDNVCAATDRVLFSSTPSDYGEPTHVNVQPPEVWAALFARRGFIRKLDLDASFVSPWAVVYERSSAPLPEVVRAYDRHLSRLAREVREVREQIVLLDQDRRAEADARDRDLLDERQRLEQELLASRDTVIRHEVRVGEALAQARRLEAELVRYETRMEQLDAILESTSWRLGGVLHRAVRRLRRRNHS